MHPRRQPDPHATIALRSVVQRFGARPALDGLCLTVHPGQVRGLLGPDGAGKTTDGCAVAAGPTSDLLRTAGRCIEIDCGDDGIDAVRRIVAQQSVPSTAVPHGTNAVA